MTDSGKWPCANCGENLGNIAFGELAVLKEGCAVINTDGVNLVLTCAKCGVTKVWFAKAPSIENAFIDALVNKIADRFQRKQDRARAR